MSSCCLHVPTLLNPFLGPTVASPSLITATPQDALVILRHQPVRYHIAPAFMKRLTQDYLKHYYLPWHNPPSAQFPLRLLYHLHVTAAQFQEQPGWDENMIPHSQRWIQDIIRQERLDDFPNHRATAIIVHPTNLRILPTQLPSFGDPAEAGQGFPFDNLQASMLDAGVPVYIMQTTKNQAWSLVVTPEQSWGWVLTRDIASVSSAFMKRWEAPPQGYLAAHIEGRAIRAQRSSPSDRGQYYFSTRIGTLYPLLRAGKSYDSVFVASRNAQGQAVIRQASVVHAAVQRWPMPANSQQVAKLINQFLGMPYGWGGLYGYRDCSATTRDLFASFAIWLPRNAASQSGEGIVYSLKEQKRDQKRQLILQRGIPFFTLLFKPGHVLLYLGQWKQDAIVFHAPWGLHTGNPTLHQEGRLIIGRAVITPVDLGMNHVDILSTWLDQITNMNYLIPAQQLITEGKLGGKRPVPQ